MKYNVNGLTFTDEELDSDFVLPSLGEISHAYYFFIPKSTSSVFTLVKPGQYLSKEALDKISGKQIFSMSLIHTEFSNHLKSILKNHKHSINEIERLNSGRDLLQLLSKYLDGSFSASLSMFKTFFQEFFELNPKIAYLLDKESEMLFQRSLVLAGFSVIHSIKLGIVDYDFLKRTYNTLFCIDLGLVLDGELTSNILIACELERKSSGRGQDFIKNSSKKEENIFLTHPEKGLAFLGRTIEGDNYKSLIEVVGTHHESGLSSGFPKGFSHSDLTSFEQIVMECDRLIPFAENLFESREIQRLFQFKLSSVKEVA
jgi:hypothetical protein